MTSSPLQALIFDVDNTICETEELLHLPCYNETRAFYGLAPWSSERFQEICRVAGGMDRLRYAFSTEKNGPQNFDDEFIAEFYAKKTEIYQQKVKESPPEMRGGVAEIIDAAHSAGLKLGIASASAKPSVLALLPGVLGERFNYFSAIFAGNDAEKKKPDPEIYQKCLKALNVQPENVCVFEDTCHGLAAAKAAGCSCIVAFDNYSASQDFSQADFVCDDLARAKVDLKFIEQIVARNAQLASQKKPEN